MLERLNDITWSVFPQPPENTADTIPSALVSLSTSDSKDGAERAYHRLLYALGNDHAGTYYPVVLNALPFLGEIVANGSAAGRKAALDVLIDLVGSFSPGPGFETIRVARATPVDLRALVLRGAQQLQPIIQATATSEEAAAETRQLARELLALLDDET